MPLVTARTSLTPDHGRRRQAIVRSLLTEICDGRLRPGERLVTQSLADRFRVSHTPVREALIELAGVGIVDHLPNRGAVVRPITNRDVREVYIVRRALECAAVRSACGRIDLRHLHSLAADIRRLKATPPRAATSFVGRACDIDSRLHDLIAESSGNTLLAKEISRLKTLFRAFRDVAWQRDEARNDTHRLADECDEHLAIVEALLARDAKAAVKAMARHINSGSRYWSRAMPARNGVPT
ncbi:MAG: GntR family transcriptional regulator [Planctomycetes bacterium]|nr:GntR family transcriptional regulator [Planctomycetota bacterium]